MKTMQQRKSFRPFAAPLATVVAGIVLAFGMQATANAADAAPPAPPHDAHKMEHDWARHRQEWMKKRLEKAAEHLGIQPSQQEAWQAYVNAIESPIGNGDAGKPADRPTDAAGIARLRADFAAAHAARMMNIANATARLQDVLTPEQQKKFNRMVAHAHRPGPRHAPDGHDGREDHRPPPPHDDMPLHDQARP